MIKNVEARNILQGLFDKWNGKSKEVVNEAKVEDVQTTIIAQPSNLYKLRFCSSGSGNGRYQVRFGKYNLCYCYGSEIQQVEDDFNKYKLGGYSTKECSEALKAKYNLRKKDYYKDFSFVKKSKSTVEFYYRFDKLKPICTCKNHHKTRAKVLNHCRELVSQGKSIEEIRSIMRPLYSSNKPRTLRHMEKKQDKVEEEKDPKPLEWSDKGELLFNGLHTGLLPSNVAMIQTLHANHSNPFIFADYVCQNLPEARPSVINYICMNYDEIPFHDLIKEGMEIMDKQRGF